MLGWRDTQQRSSLIVPCQTRYSDGSWCRRIFRSLLSYGVPISCMPGTLSEEMGCIYFWKERSKNMWSITWCHNISWETTLNLHIQKFCWVHCMGWVSLCIYKEETCFQWAAITNMIHNWWPSRDFLFQQNQAPSNVCILINLTAKTAQHVLCSIHLAMVEQWSKALCSYL